MPGQWQVEMLWRCTACGHRNLGRHLACQRCGKPKTGAEEYEMPSDTSEANAVHDAEVLRLAKGGANWRCRFCGSDQRRFDGGCATCGAAQADGRDLGAAPAAAPRVAPARRASTPAKGGAFALFAVLAVVVALMACAAIGAIVFLRSSAPPPPPPVATEPEIRDVGAAVASVAWTHAIAVERWHLVPGEGFAEAKPSDAVQPRKVDHRVHHTDKVPDGTTTETYTETVPDGFDTQTYTEDEPCGQTCTPRPQTCARKCKPSKNGFATCEDVCTGGGQDCRPKTCTRTKTRQVPRTKVVTKTRQVPRFRDEPRYADWWAWQAWAWTTDRKVEERGTTLETRWPTPDKAKLGAGEQERERRLATYEVTLQADGGGRHALYPDTLEAFQRFAVGSRHTLRIGPAGAVRCADE